MIDIRIGDRVQVEMLQVKDGGQPLGELNLDKLEPVGQAPAVERVQIWGTVEAADGEGFTLRFDIPVSDYEQIILPWNTDRVRELIKRA